MQISRTKAIRGSCRPPRRLACPGIEVYAYGTGKGMDNGQDRTHTVADGSYEMNLDPGEAYAVYVDDKDWPRRFPPRRRPPQGKPVDKVDFALTRGTVIRGTVTVGPGTGPPADQEIRIDESGGPAPGRAA